MSTDELIWDVKKDRVLRELKKGKRLDGRKKMESRKVEITPGFLGRAEGSAMVKLGNTRVVAGAKLGIGTPYPDSPEDGVLITSIELSPVASPMFETGPPRGKTVEAARVIDRGIRESNMVKTEELCIEPGEKIWTVFVDIFPMDHDGNIIDASAIAAVAALKNAKIPKYEDEKIIRDEFQGKLPTRDTPVAKTFAKIGDEIVLDPEIYEEKSKDARLTVYINDKDNVCASQKGGSGAFKREEVNKLIKEAVKKAPETRKQIEEL